LEILSPRFCRARIENTGLKALFPKCKKGILWADKLQPTKGSEIKSSTPSYSGFLPLPRLGEAAERVSCGRGSFVNAVRIDDTSHLMITSDVDEPAEKPTATYLIERRSA
jgi:hypothetical protein